MSDANLQLILSLQNKASKDLKSVSGTLRDVGKSAVAAEKSVSALGQIGTGALRQLGEFGAAGALRVGQALVSIPAAAISAAAGFEQGMSNISAVSGATAGEMERISGLALQLGKDTSFSASSAAAGIEELIKGGVGIADVMGGAAESTLALAAAGGVDLASAAEIGANALAMFNLEGSDMAMVADQIAGAANASSLSVTDFKFSLAAAGSVLSSASQTFESSATAIALMGQAGIKGSDAGTSLKSAFNQLIPTTDKATAAMRDLGIITADGTNQFINANGTFKQTGEIAEILQTALGGATDAQRALALETIFGADGMRAGIVLTKAGAEGFDQMAASMSKVTAESVAAERLNNLRGDLEQLTGSLETAGIVAGTVLLPALRDLAQGATGAVNAAIPMIELWGPRVVDGIQTAAAVITEYGVPALSALAAGTAAYGLSLIPATVSITTMTTALGAQALALTASLGPFALVAVAAGGLAIVARNYRQSLDEQVNAQKASNETLIEAARVQAVVDALAAPQSAGLQEVNTKLNEQIGIRDSIARKIESEARLGADSLPLFSAAQESRRAKLAEVEAQIDLTTAAVEREILASQTAAWAVEAQAYALAKGTIPAYISYQGALATTTEALGATGTAAAVTQQQLDDAAKAIESAAQAGITALGGWISSTLTYQGEIETASSTHWATLAGLHKEWADATTEQERTAIQARIDAENTGFATSQTNAATAYAAQASAQRTALGEMLIETVNAWAVMNSDVAARASEMTAALAEEYGVQKSSASVAFGGMIESLSEWRDNASISTDAVIGDLQATAGSAVATEQSMSALEREYIATLVQNFADGTLDTEEFTDALGRVPATIRADILSNAQAARDDFRNAELAVREIPGTTTANVITDALTARERFINLKDQQAEIRASVPADVSTNADETRGRILIMEAKRAAIGVIVTPANLSTNAPAVATQIASVGTAVRNLPSTKNITITATIDPMLRQRSPSPIENVMSAIAAFAGKRHVVAVDLDATGVEGSLQAMDAIRTGARVRPDQSRATDTQRGTRPAQQRILDPLAEWQRLRDTQWAVMEADAYRHGSEAGRQYGQGNVAGVRGAYPQVVSEAGKTMDGLLAAFQSVLSTADYTGDMLSAFGVHEDSAFIGTLLDFARQGGADVLSVIEQVLRTGDFTGDIGRAFGMEEDDPFVTELITMARRLGNNVIASAADGVRGTRPEMHRAIQDATADIPKRMRDVMEKPARDGAQAAVEAVRGTRPVMHRAVTDIVDDSLAEWQRQRDQQWAVMQEGMDGNARIIRAGRPEMHRAIQDATADIPPQVNDVVARPAGEAMRAGAEAIRGSRPNMNQAVLDATADIPKHMEAGVMKPIRDAVEGGLREIERWVVEAYKPRGGAGHRASEATADPVVDESRASGALSAAAFITAYQDELVRMQPNLLLAFDTMYSVLVAQSIRPNLDGIEAIHDGSGRFMAGNVARGFKAASGDITVVASEAGTAAASALATSVGNGASAVQSAVDMVNAALGSIPRDIVVTIRANVDPALQRNSPSIIEQTLMNIRSLAGSIPALSLRSAGASSMPAAPQSYSAPSRSSPPDSRASQYAGATIIERQLIQHITRPMNPESEFASLDAWANAGRS